MQWTNVDTFSTFCVFLASCNITSCVILIILPHFNSFYVIYLCSSYRKYTGNDELFAAAADGGSDPGIRVTSNGHVWHVRSLRQGLRHARQEEKDGDQSSSQNTGPGLQRDIRFQGQTEQSESYPRCIWRTL